MIRSTRLSRRWGATLLPSLLALLLLVGCMPIQPPTATTVSAVPTEQAQPATEVDAFAGDWEGSIAIAAIELGIILHMVPEGDGWSATLDIPQQNALGLPVGNLELTLPEIHFTILDGAQQAAFTGALGEDGVITGAFTQSGQEGTFMLARAPSAPADSAALAAPAAGASGISEIYTDTTGLWSVPVPTGWTVTPQEGFVTLQDPEQQITVHILTAAGDDQTALIADAWQLAQPGFDLPIDQALLPPAPEGIEALLVHTYDTGDNNRIVQAVAQLHNGLNFIQLYDLTLEAAQRRSAQISIVDAGFKIIGNERLDLSDVQPAELTDEIIQQWEAFITDTQASFDVPGAVVGVVRDGELVYAKGFGYADTALQTPMTPQTHMMIGSTGKSLTTMMMGSLVDDGIMTWDTPAQQLYPDFAVMDPELSKTITMRNLVCACTGVPRRDLEFLMNASELSANDVIASLRTFEFFTDFGEAFQYSNQMVATGGYIAGLAAEPAMSDPDAAYAAALKERVTGPIGMENTTLSFDEVEARANYATPHSYNALSEYVAIPLTVEQTLKPIAPAGGHWSTLEDMAKYMQTQLSTGVAPNGARVISEESLLVTREPQVKVSADVAYGLGWLVGDYKGLPMLEHGGNTLGFTSDFGFLPTANLGVIVLTNAQATNTFSTVVRVRLLELLYGVPSQVEPNIAFTLEQIAEQEARAREQLSGTLDEGAVAPFVGSYSSPALGNLEMSLIDGKLMADFGEFVTSVVPKTDDRGAPDNYVAFDPPLAGFPFRFETAEDGTPNVIIGAGLTEYVFTPVQ